MPEEDRAEDMPCMFQLTAEGDQDGREQATSHYRSFLWMQKMIRTKMQLSHQLQIGVLGENLQPPVPQSNDDDDDEVVIVEANINRSYPHFCP